MMGFLKSESFKKKVSIAQLTEVQLGNVLEQERILSDAIKVQKMLSVALNGTMKQLSEIHSLPNEFELDRKTGEIFKKENPNG